MLKTSNKYMLSVAAAAAVLAMAPSAAQAQTVITSSVTTTTSGTSGVAGGYQVSQSAVVSSSVAAPFSIDSATASQNFIDIRAGGTVQTTAASATAVSATAAADGVDARVYNAGTVSGTIDLSLIGAGAASVSNTGVISGDIIVSGGGVNTLTNTASGTITGAITGGAAVDTLNNAGSITGNVDLDADNNVVSNTGTITGTLTTGANDDTVDNSGTITGAINLGAGANTFTNTGSVSSTVTGAGGIDTLYNRGGTIAGAVNLGAGNNVVSNTGTLSSTLTLGANNDTVTNSGTIVGAVVLGDGTNTFTNMAGGSVSSTITGGANADTINNAGTVSGTVTLAAGADVVSNTGTFLGDIVGTTDGKTIATTGTIGGSITMTTGDDIVSNTGTITGNIDLGAGANTVSGTGTFSGNIVTAGGADTFNFRGATIGGSITTGGANDGLTFNGTTTVAGNIDGGAGTDTLTIAGTFSNGATITDVENFAVNSGGTFTLGTTVNGVALDVDAGGTAIVNKDATLTGTLTNDGKLNIASGVTLTADDFAHAASNTYVVNLKDASSSKVVLSGANDIDFTDTAIEVAVDSDSGYIASGTEYVIAEGGAALTDAGVVSETSVLLNYTLAASGTDDVKLTVNRVANSSVVTSGDNTLGAANALDSLGTAATGNLATIQQQMTTLSTAAAVDRAYQTLTPAVDGGVVAAANGSMNGSFNTVGNRLASLRTGVQVANADTGFSSGDLKADRGVWVEGFGNKSKQGYRGGVDGFDADTVGITVGADTASLVDKARVGAAFSYSNANIDSKNAGNASTDVNSYQVSGYGSYDLGDYFVNGLAGVALNKYDGQRTISVGGSTFTPKAEFDGMQYSAKVEAGRDYQVCELANAKVTPLASLQYSLLDMDSYTETGAGTAGLNVKHDNVQALLAGVGAKAAWDFDALGEYRMAPEVRVGYKYDLIGDRNTVNATYSGATTSFRVDGANIARNTLDLGTGINFYKAADFSVRLDYDAQLKSDFVGQTGTMKARWEF